MKLGIVVVSALAAGLLGLVVGAMLLGNGTGAVPPSEAAEEEGRRREREIARLRGEVARLSEETERVEEEADSLDAEVAAEREHLEELRQPAAETVAAVAGEASKKGVVRFFGEEVPTLHDVDWTSVGQNMHEMAKLIPEIARDLQAGRQPSAEAIGRAQQLNGPLLTAALKVQQGLPGVGVNGRFTDPSFMLNAIHTTLEVAGKPLNAAQASALEEVARAWMARDRQRREGYTDDTWTIQRLYEEAEMKDGFFADAFARLSREQVEILSPPDIRGRVRADLFSASLLYAMRIRPVVFETTNDFVEQILQGTSLTFRLTEDERTSAREVVAAWASELPRALLRHETDILDRHGMVHTKLASAWARQGHEFLKRLSAALEFDEGRMTTVRLYGAVPVGLPRRE
jgi:hypothetical protein